MPSPRVYQHLNLHPNTSLHTHCFTPLMPEAYNLSRCYSALSPTSLTPIEHQRVSISLPLYRFVYTYCRRAFGTSTLTRLLYLSRVYSLPALQPH